MRLSIYTICSVFFIVACNNKPKQHAPTDKPYHLGLHVIGTDTIRYNYTITNQTQTALEANGKKINTTNKTTAGLLYAMIKDSSGNIQLTITYNSLQVYSKNNDIEKEMDAANAPNTIDPVERLLGAIIGAKIYITLSPKGKILAIKGNEELKNKLLQSMNFKDAYTQEAIQQQLSQVLGSDFITANLEQTISVLPDSTVYIGDTWQTSSKQSGQIPLALNSTYTINAIDNNIAKLSLLSTVQSNSRGTCLVCVS